MPDESTPEKQNDAGIKCPEVPLQAPSGVLHAKDRQANPPRPDLRQPDLRSSVHHEGIGLTGLSTQRRRDAKPPRDLIEGKQSRFILASLRLRVFALKLFSVPRIDSGPGLPAAILMG